MGLETTLFSIFSGNKAGKEVAKQAYKTRQFVEGNFADQKNALAPYAAAGQTGVNALSDFVTGGADYLGESGNALLDQTAQDVTGRFSSMGLTDSGAHTNALAQALLRMRLGIRGQLFGEAGTLAGIGQNALSQRINAGAIANQGVAQARGVQGEAKAFPWLNASNALFRFEDQILNALGTAAGGGAGGGGGGFR